MGCLKPGAHAASRRSMLALIAVAPLVAAGQSRLAHAAGASTSAPAPLQPGDRAPLAELRAAQGGQEIAWSPKAVLQRGPVVLYFYPAAFTQGCSLQARAFAVRHERFLAAGASVLGVSQDPFERLRAFSADPHTCAGRVALASDADGRLTAAFGVGMRAAQPGRVNQLGDAITHARADRVSFVVARDGRIAATIAGIGPEAQVEQALGVVQRLAAGR